jgi:hypothetical protein
MGYKFINAGLAHNTISNSPKQDMIGLYQETINNAFYNASDWWTIEQETSRGTLEFEDIDVRITHVINAETGLKLGDDWKTIINKDLSTPMEVGKLYRFDGSIWILVNTEYIKNLSSSATLRRCNNTIRWIDELTGAYYEEPCAIDYQLKEPRDYSTSGSSIVTPSSYLIFKTQFNERTNKIKPNKRFLFGNKDNWTAYKATGTGFMNYLNVFTYDNTSAGIIEVTLVANYVNYETDDLVNGIADVYQNKYTLALDKASLSLPVAGTYTLVPSVTYNGGTASRTIEWVSSDTDIAKVSTAGIVTGVAIGTCTITANITDNSTSATCNITVSGTPTDNYVVVLTPNVNYILEGVETTFNVVLMKNGVAEGNTFSFSTDTRTVPYENYLYTPIDGNNFKVKNLKKYMSDYIAITCTSGIYSLIVKINLRGSW